jgi:DNA-binding response OmpR family regulator
MDKSILIVDDSVGITDTLRDALTAKGYKAATANSGEAAYRLILTDRKAYGLVIMDVEMPGWSGVETLNNLRDVEVTIPVILMSGFTSELIPAGVSFLPKPFFLRDLYEKVTQALEGDAT